MASRPPPPPKRPWTPPRLDKQDHDSARIHYPGTRPFEPGSAQAHKVNTK